MPRNPLARTGRGHLLSTFYRDVHFRATPETIEAINALAGQLNITLSEVMRRAIDDYAARNGVDVAQERKLFTDERANEPFDVMANDDPTRLE